MKNQDETPPVTQDVDQSRRRLTKAGLAAPAVLGVLASRRVLGNEYHHCTPSGHISGFASPNPNALSCNIGESASYYAASLATWPEEFKQAGNGNQVDPLLFKDSPNGAGLVRFADAYERRPTGGNSAPTYATVLDVLKGVPTNNNNNGTIPNMTLEPKSDKVDLELGQLAVAACMNALSDNGFPIGPQMVVKMFNGVFLYGTDNVTSTNDWNNEHLKDYFRTLLKS